MGVFSEFLVTLVRTGNAAAGAVVAQRYQAPQQPLGGPGKRRKRKESECTPCKAVAEIQKQRKRYGLDG